MHIIDLCCLTFFNLLIFIIHISNLQFHIVQYKCKKANCNVKIPFYISLIVIDINVNNNNLMTVLVDDERDGKRIDLN